MIDTQTVIEMQKAISRNLSFFEWWKEQTIFPQKALHTKDHAHLIYGQQEEILQTDLKRFKELIVTDTNGYPPEKFAFIIHTNEADAIKHGQATLGKRRFRIIPFSLFRSSPTFRRMTNLIALRNKLNQYKKPK